MFKGCDQYKILKGELCMELAIQNSDSELINET